MAQMLTTRSAEAFDVLAEGWDDLDPQADAERLMLLGRQYPLVAAPAQFRPWLARVVRQSCGRRGQAQAAFLVVARRLGLLRAVVHLLDYQCHPWNDHHDAARS